MRSRKLDWKIFAIFTVIIVTFTGSTLFFSALNVVTLCASAEYETDRSPAGLTDGITRELSQGIRTMVRDLDGFAGRW